MTDKYFGGCGKGFCLSYTDLKVEGMELSLRVCSEGVSVTAREGGDERTSEVLPWGTLDGLRDAGGYVRGFALGFSRRFRAMRAVRVAIGTLQS
jgi:hypothetical protein